MSRMVELAKLRGEFQTLDDGFVYYWPSHRNGAFSADNLRKLADELDRRNALWEKGIEDYFTEERADEAV